VSYDDDTNRVIVNCTETLYKDVEKLALQLDEAAGTSAEVVRVVPLVGISPSEAQMAVDALLGRPVTQPNQQQGRFGGMNGFGGGFPGGGRGR